MYNNQIRGKEMTGIKELDREDFDEVINNCDQMVIVEFYTNSCPNCKTMEPIYTNLAQNMGDKATFCRVNAQLHQEIAMLYGVQSVPTFKFFCHRKPIGEIVGAVNKTILKNTIVDFGQWREKCFKGSTPISYDMTGYV
jgi:thioredoxin-like negative regulator of GroEL